MVDDKDRFGDQLRKKEKGDEDRFFAERDRALIEKLREKGAAREAPPHCPRCGDPLAPLDHQDVNLEECPRGHGVWLEPAELRKVAEREPQSWLGRLLSRPRR